ncbi:hypothetical protein D3C83_118240 [compost metagenome]
MPAPQAAGLFRDQQVAIGKKRHAPGVLQAFGQRDDAKGFLLAGVGVNGLGDTGARRDGGHGEQ